MKAGKVYIVPIILLLVLVMCITAYSIVSSLVADKDTSPNLPSAEVQSVPVETIPTIIAGGSNSVR